MLTVERLLNGYDKSMQFKKEVTPELLDNLQKTADIINQFLKHVGIVNEIVSSGWRPSSVNEATTNAAKKSNHILGLAVDLKDVNHNIFKAILKPENLAKAQELGIYFEDPRYTPTWIHMQIVSPKSGKRIFIPSSLPPKEPNIWDGVYNKEYDNE